VLAFFAGNDVRNNSVRLEGDKCRPFFVYRSGVLQLGGPFDSSRLFRLECMLRFESRHLRVIDAIGSGRSAIRDWWRHRHEKRVVGREPGVSDMVYRAPVDPVWLDAWRVTDGEVTEMYRDAARAGAGFLLVTVGTGIQDYPNPVVRRNYMRFVGVSDLFYPDRHLKALGEREGFPVLNLAPTMQAWAEAHHVYLHGFKAGREGAGHWNVTGHHLAGVLIAQRLCALASQRQSAHTALR
jgi:hypothetical protein